MEGRQDPKAKAIRSQNVQRKLERELNAAINGAMGNCRKPKKGVSNSRISLQKLEEPNWEGGDKPKRPLRKAKHFGGRSLEECLKQAETQSNRNALRSPAADALEESVTQIFTHYSLCCKTDAPDLSLHTISVLHNNSSEPPRVPASIATVRRTH